MIKIINALCLIVLFNLQGATQALTKADYQRAMSFQWNSVVNKKILNPHVEPIWFTDSAGVCYSLQGKDGKTFYQILFTNKVAQPLFDHGKVARSLSEILKVAVNPADLPITIQSAKKGQATVIARGKTYRLDLNNCSLEEMPAPVRNPNEAKSPDGKWIAYAENYNLWIRSVATGEKKQLTKAGYKGYEYASSYGWSDIMEGENGGRPAHFSVEWSPDSRWIQTYVCDLRSARKMYLLDWSIDTLYRPKLLSYYRASPGDTGMVYMVPVILNVETGQEILRESARTTHTFPASYEWSKKPGIIYEEIKKRGFQEVVLKRLDLQAGQERVVYRETSSTNTEHYNAFVLEDWDGVLLTSEKDGWKQLYLVEITSGKEKRLAAGEFYVENISRADPKSKTVLFAASGREAGRNPYYKHFYRVGADGKTVTLLTPENANHDISLSRDGNYFVDNYSTLNQPTRTVLRSATDGRILADISTASVTELLAAGYRYPDVFSCTARDGKTTIYGTVWKPTHFDSSKKYPIIDQSYTGPHINMFPRSFLASFARNNQALAELGFIVVAIDGMGTAGRSKAFQTVSYKNMGKNLLDHVIWMRQLGTKYQWADTTRVGIFGHSAGGYDAAHAMLEYPDFYKVAVATSGDHDFRMEKDWWPEMYMGWPVDSTYHLASNITMARNLKGKLLLVHGGIDENVNPSATFKLAEALVRSNKDFDLLILPSQRHGYTPNVNDYVNKKRWNYFVQHLLGQQTIWDY